MVMIRMKKRSNADTNTHLKEYGKSNKEKKEKQCKH